MSSEDFHYIGTELELFAQAHHWKQYVAKLIRPFIKGDVLEAGAGIGTNTALFRTPLVNSWTLLEPDATFCKTLHQKQLDGQLPPNCIIFNGYTSMLETIEVYDTIIYIDVIEHIEDDHTEIQTATRLLKKGGSLIVLSPAHQYLMSPFDKAIGHYRRYSKKMMRSLAGKDLLERRMMYVDAPGLMASLANKLLLKQSSPSQQQIKFWDNTIIPVARILDPLLGYTVGKTVIGIWSKN